MNEFEEHKRQWGIDGMSADKIRLATESFRAGMLAAAKIAEGKRYIDIYPTLAIYNMNKQSRIIMDAIKKEADKL